MSCGRFEDRLDDFLEGRLSPEERLAVEAHLLGCARCALLVETLRGSLHALHVEGSAFGDPAQGEDAAPVDLAGTILTRTSGSGCGRAQQQLCALVDAELEPVAAQLVQLHLDHCKRCSALHATLLWLQHELPRLAEMAPDALLASDVVRATTALRPRRRASEALRQWWQRMLARPRFAWEAAYVGTIVLVLLFGTSVSPLRSVPSEALAAIRIDPVGALANTSRRLGDLHGTIGEAGSWIFDATAGRVGDWAGRRVEDLDERHPGLGASLEAFRRDGRAFRSALAQRDFASSSLLLESMGRDLAGAWRSLTSPSPPESIGP